MLISDILTDEDSATKLTRFETQELCRTLEIYVEDGRDGISQTYPGISRPLVPDEVLMQIQNWIRMPSSKMVWIEGPDSTSFGSGLSLAALQIYDISMRAGLLLYLFFLQALLHGSF